jgi:GNAT superfamily N-acetyltransferase
VRAGIEPQRASVADMLAVIADRRAFWGERDPTALHHVLLVHEFGEMAFVIRDGAGPILAYLFGLLTLEPAGYIHIVAVREDHRGSGLARALYARFEAVARAHGALALKAITQPENASSIAFHRALGFSAEEVPDYSGPGQTRTVLCKPLPR